MHGQPNTDTYNIAKQRGLKKELSDPEAWVVVRWEKKELPASVKESFEKSG